MKKLSLAFLALFIPGALLAAGINLPQSFVDAGALPMTGGTMSGDIDMDSFDILRGGLQSNSAVACGNAYTAFDIYGMNACYPTADATPAALSIKGRSALPSALVNTSGGNLAIAPGQGATSVDVANNANCGAGDTVTVTLNGTANVLTRGAQWTEGASGALTCASLEAAVEALTGIDASSTACAAAKLNVYLGPGGFEISVATNDATCFTVANGTDGAVAIYGSTVLDTVTSDAFISSVADPADAGVLRLGNAETICSEANPAGVDGCISYTAGNLWQLGALTATGAVVAESTLDAQGAISNSTANNGGVVYVNDALTSTGVITGTTISGTVSHTAPYFSASGDAVRTALTSVVSKQGLFQYGPGTDAAPVATIIRGRSAYPAATVNITGSQLNIAGGQGSTRVTVANNANCGAGDTMTVSYNTTTAVLTHGTQWSAGVDAAATCANLRTAVIAIVVGSDAVFDATNTQCTGAELDLYLGIAGYRMSLSTNDATCLTVANGTDATVFVPNLTAEAATVQSGLLIPITGAGFMALGTGAANDHILNGSTSFAQSSFMLGSTLGRQINFGNSFSQDYDHTTQTNPTIYVHSATNPDDNNTQWISLTHDQTNGVIDVGTGVVSVLDAVSIGTDPGDGTGLNLDNASPICWEASPAGTDACMTVTTGELFNFTGTTGMNFPNDSGVKLGSPGFDGFYYSTAQTPDALQINTGTLANHLILCENADKAYDFAHAQQTNPTLYIQSANQSATQWISLAHDQTNGVIDVGVGVVSMPDGISTAAITASGTITETVGTKGATTVIGGAEQDLTCAGGGSATLVTTGLIPDGAWLGAVTTRITTALTVSTGFSVGDGSDADLYGVQAAATQGSTTTGANHTANIANPQLAAGEVTLTFAGGNCTAGVIRVVAHYLTFGAPTSN